MYRERLQEDGINIFQSQPRCANSRTCNEGNDTATLASDGNEPNTNMKRGGPKEDGVTSRGDDSLIVGLQSQMLPVSGQSVSSRLVPKGCYRRVVCKPIDISWVDITSTASQLEIERTTPGAEQLRVNSLERARTALHGNSNKMRVAKKETYVTVAGDGWSDGCRIYDELQPAAEAAMTGTTNDGVGQKRSEILEADSVESRDHKAIHDICLRFTLPPGSFATMCLREIMKANNDLVVT